MDTKLKNNRRFRGIITVIVLLLLTFANIALFPWVNNRVAEELNKDQQKVDYENISQDVITRLYNGCYVLYLETKQQLEGSGYKASDLYLEGSSKSEPQQEAVNFINDLLTEWTDTFENERSRIHYYASDGNSYEKNTQKQLEEILKDKPDTEVLEKLKEYYQHYFVLSFDEKGNMTVTVVNGDEVFGDALIQKFQQADRNDFMQEYLNEYTEEDYQFNRIQSFHVVYGIKDNGLQLSSYNSYYDRYYRIYNISSVIYTASVGILLLLAVLMTSRRLWKDIISFNRKGNWYLLEAAVAGIMCIFSFVHPHCNMIYSYEELGIHSIQNALASGSSQILLNFCWQVLMVMLIYSIVYVTMLAIRPVFSLGIMEYIRQYSLLYQIYPWCKKKWERFMQELSHIDFSEKSSKTIFKVVMINFVIAAVCSFMWAFGIFVLICYSIWLLYFLRKYYDKVGTDYRRLMKAVNQIAEGDLESTVTEDIGVFEPFKEELSKIRTGFQKAVDEEVKSQRMRTELITNVSHDLKTPLTAITTYVELLKKEDITEEERRSYIDTLDKKSLRLKVLIEDLFEVSKASTNNITLQLMEVDVVNLLKQVNIEHTEKYTAAGLEVRWNVPDEKVILRLDNQKTYRVFENLFMNIQKYAMQNSRVYIDVTKEKEKVQISIKNISARELNIRPEELTERFVRGDSARNTEGSGLGLAIAKSFTEAQKGSFEVTVDGDLFKVVITWKTE